MQHMQQQQQQHGEGQGIPRSASVSHLGVSMQWQPASGSLGQRCASTSNLMLPGMSSGSWLLDLSISDSNQELCHMSTVSVQYSSTGISSFSFLNPVPLVFVTSIQSSLHAAGQDWMHQEDSQAGYGHPQMHHSASSLHMQQADTSAGQACGNPQQMSAGKRSRLLKQLALCTWITMHAGGVAGCIDAGLT